MSETKFTPGPWEYGFGLVGRYVDGRRNWTKVATVNLGQGDPDDDEARANARLITKAPEMHSLLIKVLDSVNDAEHARLITNLLSQIAVQP